MKLSDPCPKRLHLVLQIENALDASQADAFVLGETLDLSQPGDIARRISTPPTAGPGRRHQTESVVLPQRLRMHAGQLSRHRDDEDRGLVIG